MLQDHTRSSPVGSTGPWVLAGYGCFVLAMALPLLGVGAAWPLGYRAMGVAAWNCLSLNVAAGDGLVVASGLATAANVVFVLVLAGAMAGRGRGRAMRALMTLLAIGGAAMAAGALIALSRAELLMGIGGGYVLWLAGFVILAIGIGRASMRS